MTQTTNTSIAATIASAIATTDLNFDSKSPYNLLWAVIVEHVLRAQGTLAEKLEFLVAGVLHKKRDSWDAFYSVWFGVRGSERWAKWNFALRLGSEGWIVNGCSPEGSWLSDEEYEAWPKGQAFKTWAESLPVPKTARLSAWQIEKVYTFTEFEKVAAERGITSLCNCMSCEAGDPCRADWSYHRPDKVRVVFEVGTDFDVVVRIDY